MAKFLASGTVSAIFLLVLCCAVPTVSQQPATKPDAPAPKISTPNILSPRISATTEHLEDSAKLTPLSPVPELEGLHDLAGRLIKQAKDSGCNERECKILVTDFLLTDGYPSAYGTQFADDLSTLFSENGFQVIARSLLRAAQEKCRMSSRALSSASMSRWLGQEVSADVVLVGSAARVDINVVEFSAHLLKVNGQSQIGPSLDVRLLLPESIADLSPKPDFDPLPPLLKTSTGKRFTRPASMVSLVLHATLCRIHPTRKLRVRQRFLEL